MFRYCSSTLSSSQVGGDSSWNAKLQFHGHLLDLLGLAKLLSHTGFVKVTVTATPVCREPETLAGGSLCCPICLSKALTQVTSDNVLKANNVYAYGLLSVDVRKERRHLLQ